MKNKNRSFQIVAWGVCIVVAIGLFSVVAYDRKQYSQRIVQLQMEAVAAEQESNAKNEAIAAIYDETVENLKVDSIVCWGDGEMVGRKDISLASVLQETVQDNLFKEFNKSFSKVIQGGNHTSPKITINNMGVTNEGMRQILARAGVTEIEIREWLQIPSDTDPVTLSLRDNGDWNDDDEELRFAKQSKESFGKVWISDIEGTLVTTDDWYDSNHPRYAFVRDEEGDSLAVNAGTIVEIESATKYLGDIPVFFFSDSTARSIDSFIASIEELAHRYAGSNEDDTYIRSFVVICTAKEGSDLDEALQNAFGSRYIRNNMYVNEMTNKDYKNLAQQVYENLDDQESFGSVKERIANAIKEAEGL